MPAPRSRPRAPMGGPGFGEDIRYAGCFPRLRRPRCSYSLLCGLKDFDNSTTHAAITPPITMLDRLRLPSRQTIRTARTSGH